MTLIVYGKNKEIFESNQLSVPRAIIELYEYCGGHMGKELFTKIIEGLIETGTPADMVDVFDHMSCERPIVKIYTDANSFFKVEDEDGK